MGTIRNNKGLGELKALKARVILFTFAQQCVELGHGVPELTSALRYIRILRHVWHVVGVVAMATLLLCVSVQDKQLFTYVLMCVAIIGHVVVLRKLRRIARSEVLFSGAIKLFNQNPKAGDR